MDDNQTKAITKRGGKREGAGRKPLDYNERWFAARGIRPLHASEILSKVADERKMWVRLLNSDDDRIVLQAMMFLVQMRDGKPAQQINVTSMNVTFSADEIAKARAVVRELVPREARMLTDGIAVSVDRDTIDSGATDAEFAFDSPGEEMAKHYALGGQGPKMDGVVDD